MSSEFVQFALKNNESFLYLSDFLPPADLANLSMACTDFRKLLADRCNTLAQSRLKNEAEFPSSDFYFTMPMVNHGIEVPDYASINVDAAPNSGLARLRRDLNWSMLEGIKAQDPISLHWLSLCAFLKPQEIPKRWLTRWLKMRHRFTTENARQKSNRVIYLLQKHALIRFDKRGKKISLHRISQKALIEFSGPEGPAFAIETLELLSKLSTNFEWRHAGVSQKGKVWLKHAEFYFNHTPAACSATSAKVLNAMGNLFTSLNRHQEAINCTQTVFAIIHELHRGAAHPDIVNTYWNLGICFLKSGQYEEALDCNVKADQMRQKLFKGNPPSDLTQALIFSSMGVSHAQLGAHDKALESDIQALEIMQGLYPDQPNPDYAQLLEHMGICYARLGKHQGAFDSHQLALAMRQKLFSNAPHPDLARSFEQMGICHFNRNQLTEALESHQLALKMRMSLYLNEPHSDLASSFERVGVCHSYRGNFEEALKYHTRALGIREKVFLNEPHSDIARSLRHKGLNLEKMRRFKEALDYFQKSLEMRKKISSDIIDPQIIQLEEDIKRVKEHLPKIQNGKQEGCLSQ